MIRHLKPARFIEAGCGMSSCVILDTLEAMKLNTRLTLIEPYPEFLLQLIQPGDRGRFELKQQCMQDVPLDLFTSLEDGDILFIDTSHSSKIGSDVNHIFFQVLPLLKKGVYVHFHDIWYPFEYPVDGCNAGCSGTKHTCCGPSSCSIPASRLSCLTTMSSGACLSGSNPTCPCFVRGLGKHLAATNLMAQALSCLLNQDRLQPRSAVSRVSRCASGSAGQPLRKTGPAFSLSGNTLTGLPTAM